MKRLIIKVATNPREKAVQIEVRNDQLLKDLIPFVVKALGWPEYDVNEIKLNYWFTTPLGAPINYSLTLEQAGVKNSSLLLIQCGETYPDEVTKEIQINLTSTTDDDKPELAPNVDIFDFKPIETEIPHNISIQDRRTIPNVPPSWKKVQN